jgi:pimeloyl-ACP methyl ester carboxylesterase
VIDVQMKRLAVAVWILVMLSAVAAAIGRSQLPAIGAGALLYPARHVSTRPTPAGCVDRTFDGVRARLAGWVCTTESASSKPTIVYLHGIADNRDSSTGVIDRFQQRGFSVIVYDSRGHGRSEGDRCTYGFFEKQDLVRVLDQAGVDSAILIGHSLGAAVALQAAATDTRIKAVVAASTFADLRSIAAERAPFVFTPSLIDAALKRAEQDAQFVVDQTSPLLAAAVIKIPVFIIHGALDHGTRPAHSERVFAALRGPKKLLIVSNAGHNDVLKDEAWETIERWIDALH